MVSEGQVLPMVSLVAIVVVVGGGTWWVMVMVRGIMICILCFPGLLSKAMFNRMQSLHLSRVLLPY